MPSLLMIDDDPMVCRSATRLLRLKGIDVSAHAPAGTNADLEAAGFRGAWSEK